METDTGQFTIPIQGVVCVPTRGTTWLSLAATRLLPKSTEAPNTPGWSAQGLVSSWRTRTPTLVAPCAVLAHGPRPRTEAA